jgi:SAM-dependent methyltransferase
MDDEDGYFGERVAATYDDPSTEAFKPSVVDAAVGVLAELADGGRALELGIGTGRIALPLARRGVPVHGIDLSRAMVARLRAKPGGEPGGGFVIEVMIPDLRKLPAGQNVVPFRVSPTHWAFDAYDVATQAMSSNYVEVVDGRGEYRSIPFRYVWPAELDLMAQLAGLRLRERWDGWTREPFTNESRQHVSVWEKPTG